jgi:sialic acid synthase SpsE
LIHYTSNKKPSRSAFKDAYYSQEGQNALKNTVTLMHCTTEYPADPKDINLGAIETLSRCFKLPFGLSDHSESILIPQLAISLGAVIIEKHFTLDKSLPGPDHRASLDVQQFQKMIEFVKITELALENGIKSPKKCEMINRSAIRKSLVSSKSIEKGELFLKDNLTIKRPGYDRSPMDYWDVIDTKSIQKYSKDEVIH